jgi:hypothetical protein
MSKHYLLAAVAAASLFSCQAAAQEWTVRPEWVRAHESFLASEALQGRGSATRDEAIAAAYVAAQFESFGLKLAPGMPGYLQKAEIIRFRLDGAPVLTVGGKAIVDPRLLIGRTDAVTGKLHYPYRQAGRRAGGRRGAGRPRRAGDADLPRREREEGQAGHRSRQRGDADEPIQRHGRQAAHARLSGRQRAAGRSA